MDKLITNDAHCHLYAYNNTDTIEKVIQSSKSIRYICENATSVDNFAHVIDISKKYPDRIIPSIGIHPLNYKSWNDEIKNKMEELLVNNGNLMVGEIGLDFVDKGTDKKKQIEVFRDQFELGIKYKRTISIHSVRSHGDMLKTLKKLFKTNSNLKEIPLIMHSYSGTTEIMKSLLKLSNKIYFSFSLGIINSINNTNIDNIPLDNILVETDSPYQLDEKLPDTITIENQYCEDISSSKLNLPNNSILVLKHIATAKDVEVEILSKIVNDNFKRAFNIEF